MSAGGLLQLPEFSAPQSAWEVPGCFCQSVKPHHATAAAGACPARRRCVMTVATTRGRENMAKKVAGQLKLQVPAGSATPSPPIGPALGQRGINIMEFCKAIQCRHAGNGKRVCRSRSPSPTTRTSPSHFAMKQPPVSFLLKKEAKLKSGSQDPGQGDCRLDHARPGPHDRRSKDEGS